MELHEVIREAIQTVVNDMPSNHSLVIGTATNVTDTTCDVTRDGSPDINGVLLNATADTLQSYLTIVPKEGSMVIVGRLEGNKQQAVVLRCTEVEKIIWKVGNQTFRFDTTDAVFNNGNNGGMVKINPLKDNQQTIINYLQAMVTAIATGLTAAAGNDGTAGTSFTTSMAAQSLAMQDMENTKVKH